MALVRVYCGIASADPADRPAAAGPTTLTSAVVDDAGRLLQVCEINDDAAGYARLGAFLIERVSGPNGAAIAADSDDHLVTSLLSAAGRPLAIADDDLVDDFAEQFADDDSMAEMQSSPAQRRAVGLARALQAGALSAVALPAPRDLVAFQPVLAAHAALVNGRHAAAVALREVLRELYPAALRAYADPAERLSLAILDALPEAGMLVPVGSRGREGSTNGDAVAKRLAADGVADPEEIDAAITALRIAIGETPRRGPVSAAMSAATAETVRQAVAAVRACDSGCTALIDALATRVGAPPATGPRRPLSGSAAGNGRPASTRTARPESTPTDGQPESASAGDRRPRPTNRMPAAPQPATPRPVAPPPVAPPPVAPPPVAPAAALEEHSPTTGPERPLSRPAAGPHREDTDDLSGSTPPAGMTLIRPGKRPTIAPVDAGEPFRPTLTTAAINSARAERQRSTAPRPKTGPGQSGPSRGFGATDLPVPLPAPQPEPDRAPPGSRANWPLVPPAEESEQADASASHDSGTPARPEPDPGREHRQSGQDSGPGRVTPPWLADDLPPEPPALRLVDSSLSAQAHVDGHGPGDGHSPLPEHRDTGLEQPAGRRPEREPVPDQHRPAPHQNQYTDGERPGSGPYPGLSEASSENPSLHLVNLDDQRTPAPAPRRSSEPISAPPVADEGDGDLLIFAATRSAWFTDRSSDSSDVGWSFTADSGWQAAEQAARPAVGAETSAGLPRRVPQANLVPGSPLRDERPLRIVRDPARMAEHTTGYFRGWRRGQEIGGFAVGGRPGRESAGGWDFSREPDEVDLDQDYEYRSAGRRS